MATLQETAADFVNAYELERDRRIARNLETLRSLGLNCVARDGFATKLSTYRPNVAAPAPKRAKLRAITETAAPSRVSKRLRGDVAPNAAQIQAIVEVEKKPSKATSRRGMVLRLDGPTVCPAFSLRSIGTTVWQLGEIYRGPWAQRYWSNSGCLYHHAYPVGYRASKAQFGRTYQMRIDAGPQGPIFTVSEEGSARSFSGASPTSPWTDVCVALHTGQRISGPLFFGFSDPLTMRAIAAMYTAEELEAAQQGQRAESLHQTAPERASKEFRTVPGIGEAAAMALALTPALGGAPHADLSSLRQWARTDGNAEILRAFLLDSEEMPVATRRWPAWRHRMVPKILKAVCDLEGGPEDGVTAALRQQPPPQQATQPGRDSSLDNDAPDRTAGRSSTTESTVRNRRRSSAQQAPRRLGLVRVKKVNSKFADYVE